MEKSKVQENLTDLLERQKLDIFSSMNCIKIGKIVSFDKENQTATIQLLINKKHQDKIKPHPLLLDCPVVFLKAGKINIKMVPEENDECLVFFNDRSIDEWFETGNQNTPSSKRQHSLNDGIALVGISSMGNLLSGFQDGKFIIQNDTTKLLLTNSKFDVENTSQKLSLLIDSLIDAISGITAGGFPIDPPHIITLNNLKTQFNLLLGE